MEIENEELKELSDELLDVFSKSEFSLTDNFTRETIKIDGIDPLLTFLKKQKEDWESENKTGFIIQKNADLRKAIRTQIQNAIGGGIHYGQNWLKNNLQVFLAKPEISNLTRYFILKTPENLVLLEKLEAFNEDLVIEGFIAFSRGEGCTAGDPWTFMGYQLGLEYFYPKGIDFRRIDFEDKSFNELRTEFRSVNKDIQKIKKSFLQTVDLNEQKIQEVVNRSIETEKSVKDEFQKQLEWFSQAREEIRKADQEQFTSFINDKQKEFSEITATYQEQMRLQGSVEY